MPMCRLAILRFRRWRHTAKVPVTPSMFGFIKSPCRSCAAASASEYRSWFCGLGCALSRHYSPAARFLVNHDSTFLAITAAGSDPQKIPAVVRTCCNPLAASRPIQSENWATRYAAAVTICALRVKAEDECDDERGLRRQTGRLAKWLSSPAAETATAELNTFGFPSAKVWQTLHERAVVETPSAGLREAASPAADAYRDIFAFPGQYFSIGRSLVSQLSALGESMGRLVYWKDALDDREADAKHGRYNPLSYHREGRLRERLTEEAARFRSAATSLAPTSGALLPALADGTTAYHFNGESDVITDRRKKKKESHWSNCCDPVSCCCDCPTSKKGGCLDGLFDCGAGDTGCCDCADACDCCPCN